MKTLVIPILAAIGVMVISASAQSPGTGGTQQIGSILANCMPGTFQFPCFYVWPMTVGMDNVNAASPANALDFWQFNASTGGANQQGARQTLDTILNFNAPSNASNTNRNYVAVVGQTNINASESSSGFFGANFVVRNAGQSVTSLLGQENDLNSVGSQLARLGYSAVSFPTTQGSTWDAAYEIGAAGGTGHIGWHNGILLTGTYNGSPPLDSSGCALCTDGAAATIGKGIDLSSYTISGNFLNSNGFTVSGTGSVTLNNISTGASVAYLCITSANVVIKQTTPCV